MIAFTLPKEFTKLTFLGLICIAALLESLGDIALKKWSIASNTTFLLTGMVLYFLTTLFWAYSLKYEDLSKAISVISILNLIVVILAGIFIFREQPTTINKFGILLGIISIVLIEY